jgi:hypothetical protein
MFGASRVGFCKVEGSPDAISALASGLGLARTGPRPAYGDLTCLALPEFGHLTEDGYARNEGVAELVPALPLPTNADNVRLVSVFVAANRACVELEYPYG